MLQSSEPRPKRRLRRRYIAILCVLMLTLVGTGLYFGVRDAVRDAREAARRCWCNNQLKQITLAIHTYQQSCGFFPPAYWPDRRGRPMHSWRVLMLPFIEGDDSYRQYKFDEPWNSPHNSTLAALTIHPEYPEQGPVYRCPSDWGAGKYESSKFVFVGPHTAFNGSHPAKSGDFTDGLSNTALGGEMSASGIHWMEPRDLNVEEMSFKINDQDRVGLRSNHPHGANIALADGSVRWVNDDIDPKLVKALITIDGKEDVSAFSNR
jgi:prepilin-type processing-associated H-X9-DG protein